MEGTLSSRYA